MAIDNIDITPPKYGPGDFSAELYKMIRGIPQAYEEGSKAAFERGQRARTEELQKPIDPNINYAGAIGMILQKEGIPGLEKVAPTMGALEAYRAAYPPRQPGAQPSAGESVPPYPSIPPSPVERRELGAVSPQLGEEPAEGTVNPAREGSLQQNLTGPKFLPPTVNRIAEANHINPSIPEFAGAFRGVDPNRELTQDQARGVQAKIDRMRQDPNLRAQMGAAPGPSTPIGGVAEARRLQDEAADQRRAAAHPLMNEGTRKSLMDDADKKEAQAKQILDKVAEYGEPTTAVKEWEAGKLPGESFTEFEARRAGEKAASVNEQSKVAAQMDKLAEAGLNAIGHKAMLDAVKTLGERVPYGIIPKIQSELGRFGIETKGLSDIQAYEAAIDYMAPQLRPPGSGRLMQQELTAFKGSLGGLMKTKEGREISVENLKLLSDYTENIGRIASDPNIPMNRKMQEIYKVPRPQLKTLADADARRIHAPSRINDKAAYDALQPGTSYIAPDGSVRIKQ
jgi:hypothetical protein